MTTAFSAARKRLRASGSPTEGGGLVPGPEGATLYASLSSQRWATRLLLPLARLGFRLARPILLPIASLTRDYLMDGLRHSILHEIQRAHDVTLLEVQTRADATIQEIQMRSDRLAARLDRIEGLSTVTARRVAITCANGEALVRTEVGFVICPADDHTLLACLIETGELERGTRILIQKFLKPGDVYVDVGAHVGMHVLAAARAMEGRGKIIAFEPFKPTVRMLEKSLLMNGFSDMAEVHQAAVSSSLGLQKLHLGTTNGHHSLFELNVPPDLAEEPVEVPVVRLDGVIPAGQRIDLLKIDAEGAELDVIEGGASLITGNSDIALIVEFGPSHLRRTGRTASQWLGGFAGLGLDYRVINDVTGALETWSLQRLEAIDSVNLFFSRNDSKAWSRLTE